MRRTSALVATAVAFLVAAEAGADAVARLGHRTAASIGTAATIETEAGSQPVGALEGAGALRGSVTVTNSGDRPEVVDVQPVVAKTASTFGIVYAPAGSPVRGAARHVTVADSELRLAAGESRRVSVDVGVPAEASPGDYVSGISVASRRTVGDGMVRERTRNVVPVVIRVPGSDAGRLALTGSVARGRGPGTVVELDMRNASRRILGDTAVAVRVQQAGRVVASHAGTPGSFAPGTSVRYPIRFAEDFAAGTELRVTGKVRHSGGSLRVDRLVTVT